MSSTQTNSCEICNKIFSDINQLIFHYLDTNLHKPQELNISIKNTGIRNVLGLQPITNITTISQNEIRRKCEICDVIVDSSYQKYILHCIQNHNPQAAKSYIKDPYILEAILTGNFTKNKKCDICNSEISKDVFDYIVHLQKLHSHLINSSLYKHIPDDYVTSVLLNKIVSTQKDIFTGKRTKGNCIIQCTKCFEEVDMDDYKQHMMEHKQMDQAFSTFYGTKTKGNVSSGIRPFGASSDGLQEKNRQLTTSEKTLLYYEKHGFDSDNEKKKYNGNSEKNKPNDFNKNNNNHFENFFSGGIFNNETKTESLKTTNKEKDDSNSPKSNLKSDNNLGNLFNLLSAKANSNTININFNINSNNQISNSTNINNTNSNNTTNTITNISNNNENSEEIKKLQEELNLIKSKLEALELKQSETIQEQEKLQKDVSEKMLQKNFKMSQIEAEILKLSQLENQLTETNKKIEELNGLKIEYDQKFLEQDKKIEKIEEDYRSKIEELEKQYKFLNSQNNNLFADRLNEVEKELNKRKLEYKLKSANDIDFTKPSTWVSQKDNLALIQVDRNSQEFFNLSTLFKRTMPLGNILKITRIQNLELWKNFCFSKYQLLNKGNASTKFLFHGTKTTNPSIIYSGREEGFDMRFANNGLWGSGIYFHEKASYSNDYSHLNDSTRSMFIAEVLVGDYIEKPSDFSLRLPPFKDNLNKIRYDCVKSNIDGIYVIYNNMRAYPSYLVEFSL